MKITKEIWSLGELERIQEFKSIYDAVQDAVFNGTYELLGRLVEAAFNDEYKDKKQALQFILGSGYEVEE